MIQITVTDEQARLIAGASAPVVLVDSHGQPLGQVSALDARAAAPTSPKDDLDEIKRRMRSPGNYVPLDQIKEQLGWQDQI